MKKSITIIISLFIITSTTSAQITIPDFSLTDIDGNTYSLYQELENGKTVVLDFFALQCGSCQTGIAYLENVWQTYGNSGNDVWIWAIEMLGGTNFEIQDFIQFNGGTFPGFSINQNDTLYSFFDISYTPQYFVICPNGYIKSCGVEQVATYVEACQEVHSVFEHDNYSKSEISSISSFNNIEVSFVINSTNRISFDLYDLLGNKISTVTDFYPKGAHSILINKTGLSNGYYFLRMFEGEQYVSSKKFVVQ